MSLAMRMIYGRAWWFFRPNAPLACKLPSGGVLILEQHHSFTHALWPDIDHYEPDVRAAVSHFLKPGGTFVDCGSNVGYFSVLAGNLVGAVGRVYSIEANPVTFQLLERNLKANGFGIPVHCALVTNPGEVELFVPAKGDVFSSLRKSESFFQNQEVQSIKVRGRTLDEVLGSFGLEHVDVIKIDIEGGELDVLRSARVTLQKIRPLVICEYGTNTWPAFGATVEGLRGLLEQCNYSAWIFKDDKLSPVQDKVWSMPYVNLILQPNKPGASPSSGGG